MSFRWACNPAVEPAVYGISIRLRVSLLLLASTLSAALGADPSVVSAAEGVSVETYVLAVDEDADLNAVHAVVTAIDGVGGADALPRLGRLLVIASPDVLATLRHLPGVSSVRSSLDLEPALSESTVVIGADQAAASGHTGAGKVVVVVDSGVDTTHPALAGVVVHEACFVQGTGGTCPGTGAPTAVGPGSAVPCVFSAETCAHGTHVAGIVASRDTTRPGVAPGTALVAIRVVTDDGSIESAGVLAALDHVASLAATMDIAAVNLSFGRTGGGCFDPDMQAAVDTLAAVGIAVVAASGNGPATPVTYPACLDGVVAVGSAEPSASPGDPPRVVSDFTQYDGGLALVAPGRSVESTVTTAQHPSGFDRYTGTSMAAPHVSGAIALLEAAHPEWSIERIVGVLRWTGAPIPRLAGSATADVYPEPRLAAALAFVPFDDAGPGYSQGALDWARATGASEGVGGNRFSKDRAATRAEVATLIWRFLGAPAPGAPAPFDDVAADAYYADAVAWMAEQRITNGTTTATFSPDDPISRAEIATLMWRVAGSPGGHASPAFDDVAMGRYYTEAVAWMVRWAITTGTAPTMFSPDATTTREQAITFLWRFATTRDAWHAASVVPDPVLS